MFSHMYHTWKLDQISVFYAVMQWNILKKDSMKIAV